MSTTEIYFWGLVSGVAFYQAAMNTLDIIKMRRKRGGKAKKHEA